jgi:hypothetical protein
MYRVANRLLEWAFDLADVLCVAVTGRATDEWDVARAVPQLRTARVPQLVRTQGLTHPPGARTPRTAPTAAASTSRG